MGVGRKRQKTRERWFCFSYLIIPTIGFFIFYVYANIDSFFMAFQRPLLDGTGRIVWSLDNFRNLFSSFKFSGEIAIATRNTILFWLNQQIITYPLCVFAAYFIYKKVFGYRIYRTLVYFPGLVSATVLATLVRYTVGVGGPYEALCNMLNIDFVYPFASERLALPFLLLYNIIFCLSGIVIPCGAMNGIDKEILEAGELDGCNWFNEFTRLIIPMIWPTISTQLILNIAGMLGADGQILLFTNGRYNTQTLNYTLYCYTAGEKIGATQDLNYAATIGFMMTLFTLPCVFLSRWLLNKQDNI